MAPVIVLQVGSVRATTGPTFDSCNRSLFPSVNEPRFLRCGGNRTRNSFLGQQLAFKPRSNPQCNGRPPVAPVSSLNGRKEDDRGDDVVHKEALQKDQSGEFTIEDPNGNAPHLDISRKREKFHKVFLEKNPQQS